MLKLWLFEGFTDVFGHVCFFQNRQLLVLDTLNLPYVHRTIVKSSEDSSGSKEHSRYLQSIKKVLRKLFLRHFQKAFCLEIPFLCFVFLSDEYSKKRTKMKIFEKKRFLKKSQKKFSQKLCNSL